MFRLLRLLVFLRKICRKYNTEYEVMAKVGPFTIQVWPRKIKHITIEPTIDIEEWQIGSPT